MNLFSQLFGGSKPVNLQPIIQEGAFLVDVRTPGEFAQGHVKGSVNIPLDLVPAQLQKFKGKKNIVVCCRSGSRSSQAKTILERNGFTNVINGGTWEDVKDLIKIIGYHELKRVYEDVTDRKIGNYIPEMLDLMRRITMKYAS